MKNIFFITQSKKNRIEYLILENFSNRINANIIDYRSSVCEVYKIYGYINLLFKIKKNDIVIFHSPLVYFSLIIFIFKILKRKPVGIIWDVYPVTINGIRYDARLLRRIFDFLEKKSMNSLFLKRCRKN
jgi:hypothetical protein